MPFKQGSSSAQALVAAEYQKLLTDGTLRRVEIFPDSLGVYHVYKHPTKDIFILFRADGTLASVWTKGGQTNAWLRAKQWMNSLPFLE